MPQTIAIIGAGFSGAMLTVQILRQSPDAKIILIGDHGFGRGQAYSTKNPAHLLNVRAESMSAFPDQPDHFINWMQARYGDDVRGTFVSRCRYGVYVRHNLAQALRDGGRQRTRLIREQAVSVTGDAPHTIRLADGRQIVADRIVLATGNFPPASLPAVDDAARASALYAADPWKADATGSLPADASVLLIGTGLTMVDVVVSLLQSGHKGKIQCLSRHGALPLPHTDKGLPPEPCAAAARGGLMPVLRSLKAQARAAMARGDTWQQIIDGLRHDTIPVWRGLSLPERNRFLRHPRRLWEVHRHRMAPQIAAQIAAAQDSGQLVLQSGHLRQLTVKDGVAIARYQARGTGETVTLHVARVINCAGPASDFRKLQDPLLRQLLDSNQVRPDACRLGFDVSADSALIAEDGTVSKTMFGIGPMTKSAFWEIVAVPDIRLQCQTLAQTLLA